MHTTFKDTVYENLILVHVLKSSWPLGRMLAYYDGCDAAVVVAEYDCQGK